MALAPTFPPPFTGEVSAAEERLTEGADACSNEDAPASDLRGVFLFPSLNGEGRLAAGERGGVP